MIPHGWALSSQRGAGARASFVRARPEKRIAALTCARPFSGLEGVSTAAAEPQGRRLTDQLG
jgi:hypothetical protein